MESPSNPSLLEGVTVEGAGSFCSFRFPAGGSSRMSMTEVLLWEILQELRKLDPQQEILQDLRKSDHQQVIFPDLSSSKS